MKKAGPAEGVRTTSAYDRTTLQGAGRNLIPPFRLALAAKENCRELICTDIIRNLPGKRLTLFGMWENKTPVVGKVYLDPRRGRRHFKREVRGLACLEKARIPTVPVLFAGMLADGQTPIFLTQRVGDALNLGECIASEEPAGDDALRLLKRVVTTIAQMHGAGISQRDIHPGNFLLRNDDVMVIDGADIQKHLKTPLPERPSIANLALFLAQFYPGREAILTELITHYGHCREWPMTPERQKRVQDAIRQWSDWREKKFLRKTLRSCTAFIAEKTWYRRKICDRTWQAHNLWPFLPDIDAAITNGSVLKAGNTATVVRITSGNQPLVVKRYNIKNPWHALRRAMRPTRAMISWRNSNRLRFMGVPTPEPLAVVENRWGPLRGRAYFITAYLAGEPIDSVVDKNKTEPDNLAFCADLILQLLIRLHRLRLSHSDLKASNLLLCEGQLYVLDLDGMQKHYSYRRFQRAFQRDVKRLLQNWRNDASFHSMLETRIRKGLPNA